MYANVLEMSQSKSKYMQKSKIICKLGYIALTGHTVLAEANHVNQTNS